jgi:D-alanine transaminase
MVTSRRKKLADPRAVEDGIAATRIPDIRWQRCDIKSVSLLPSVLGKQRARERGAFEAWPVDRDGMVSEGISTNAWMPL